MIVVNGKSSTGWALVATDKRTYCFDFRAFYCIALEWIPYPTLGDYAFPAIPFLLSSLSTLYFPSRFLTATLVLPVFRVLISLELVKEITMSVKVSECFYVPAVVPSYLFDVMSGRAVISSVSSSTIRLPELSSNRCSGSNPTELLLNLGYVVGWVCRLFRHMVVLFLVHLLGLCPLPCVVLLLLVRELGLVGNHSELRFVTW